MEKVVTTAPRAVLLSRDYVHALAKAVIGLNLSRRKTPDWLADVIFGWAGEIRDGEGRLLDLHDEAIDDAHGSDAAFTWISDMRGFAVEAPRRRPRSSMLPRLQLYDAAFKIVGRPVETGPRDEADFLLAA